MPPSLYNADGGMVCPTYININVGTPHPKWHYKMSSRFIIIGMLLTCQKKEILVTHWKFRVYYKYIFGLAVLLVEV